jgi:uncharacterized protein (TIGR03382 family)
MRAKLVGLVVLAWLAWGHAARAQMLVATPDPLAFGSVVVGTTATQVENVKASTGLFIANITSVTPQCATDWTVATTSPALPANIISGGVGLNITVQYAPTTRGSSTCPFLVMGTNGGTQPIMVTFTATGTGIGPVSTVSPDNGPPLDFGSVKVGQNDTFNVTISNTTTDPGQNLHFAGPLTINGGFGGDYAITSTNPPADVAPGMSTVVAIKFAPTATGTRSGTLTIKSNDFANPTQTVALTGVGTSNASISSAASIAFGNVLAGVASSNTDSVLNAGTAGNLDISSATITGGSGWFVFTNNPAGTPSCAGAESCTYSPAIAIAPGGTRNMQVQCAPPLDTTGTQMATLTVTSDSTTSGGNVTMLTCTAVKPDISISTLNVSFGNVHIGGAPATSTIVIGNTGGAQLNYASLRSNGGSSGDFTISGPGCPNGSGCPTYSIAPGGPASTYTITFTPTASGPRSATLTISSNDQDPTDSPQTVTLTGTGTQAVLAGTPAPAGALAFGNQAVGASSSAMTITAMNSGNENLSITSAALAGTSPGEFQLTSGSTGAQTVAPGNMATWSIVCHPTSRGGKSATFTVANNSANAPSYTVNLTCTGTGPNLVVDTNPVAFGNVREGMVATQMFMLTNNGETTANISAVTLAPGNVGYTASGVAAGDTIAAGTSKQVTVTFAPLAGMDGGAATLTIASDAVNTPTVVDITGVGQPFGISMACPDCSGSPPMMDYGNVRWDQSKPEVFTIQNTSTADVTITSIALTETADFQLSGAPATPFVMHAGVVKTMTVTASPNDTMLGTFTGKLQISTDLPSPMNLIERPLSVTSVSPAFSVQPGMTVDFGAVDLAVGSSTMTVAVQNTGNGTMSIVQWPALNDPHFASVAIAPFSLAAGAMQTLDVTYTPTVEGTAQNPDTVDLVITIDGLFAAGVNQPSMQKITFTGHGATRHIALTGSPITFGATYRNPSTSNAPVQMVTVMNTGEAPLSINASLDPNSDPAFTLLDSGAITVPGGGSMPLHVRFLPTTDTGTFTGSLVITDDDTATPMETVPITGTAAARMITAAPAAVDFGDAYAHVAVKLSDSGNALVITNNATDHSVTVRELDVTDDADGVFSVVTPGGAVLGPGQSASFDLAFQPDAVGDFTAHVKVFFDDDTIPDATVDVTGTGIEGRGSYYACGAGSNGAGAAPIGLALLVLVVRRRRRR